MWASLVKRCPHLSKDAHVSQNMPTYVKINPDMSMCVACLIFMCANMCYMPHVSIFVP